MGPRTKQLRPRGLPRKTPRTPRPKALRLTAEQRRWVKRAELRRQLLSAAKLSFGGFTVALVLLWLSTIYDGEALGWQGVGICAGFAAMLFVWSFGDQPKRSRRKMPDRL